MVERPDAERYAWANDRFEAWLEQASKKGGRTKQETLHRMMAAFWVLAEFEDLVDSEPEGQLSDLDQGFPLDDFGRNQSQEPHTSDSSDAPGPGPDAGTIHRLVDEFAAYLDAHASDHDTPTTAQSAGTPDDTEDRLTNLEVAVDALWDRQDDAITDHTTLSENHEELAERVDSDMEKVQEILNRLITKYQQSGSSLKQIESTLTTVRTDRQSEKHERNQLAALLQAGHVHGATAGTCDHCSSRIVLGLLTRPRCPHCKKQLVDVRSGGWFRSNTILTTDADQHRSANPSRSRTDTQTDAREPHHQRTEPARQMNAPPDTAGVSQETADDLSFTDQDESAFEWVDW